MVQFILIVALGAAVFFFLIEGYYLKRDVEDDFQDPFEEDNQPDDEDR